MGFFKRLGLFVYALAGLFCLASLGLYVFRTPYYHTVAELMEYEWYRVAVVAGMAITAAGALIALIRSLFAPRKRKEVLVSQQGDDSVSITTAAITSQINHIVERSNDLTADKLAVDIKGRDRVKVKVRVRPRYAVNVLETGSNLRDELSEGLAAICGDRVSGIDLQFVESDSAEPAGGFEQHEHVPAADVHVEVPTEPQEVTIPMTAAGASAYDDTNEAGGEEPVADEAVQVEEGVSYAELFEADGEE